MLNMASPQLHSARDILDRQTQTDRFCLPSTAISITPQRVCRGQVTRQLSYLFFFYCLI
jgi:hypothetical protein